MSKNTRTVAVMDIGSNTSLLLIARLFPNKKVEVLEDRLFYTRLAEGFPRLHESLESKKEPEKYIQPQALKRQAHFFEQARALLRPHFVQHVKCVATAAGRQAQNKEQLITLSQQYGFCLNIISPEEEAQLSWKGALFKLPVLPKTAVVLDIGGASTEISSQKNLFSLPMGSVNLTESFLPTDPPTNQETQCLEHHIKQEIHRIPFSFPQKSILVATAGVPTTLALMQNQSLGSSARQREGAYFTKAPLFPPLIQPEPPPTKGRLQFANKGYETYKTWSTLHGTKLSLKQVEEWHKNMFRLPVEKRKKIKGMPIYRADVMPAGLSVLKQIMYRFHWNQCVVSMTGLRYGLLCQFYATLNKK